MTYEQIQYEVADRIATITLDRPEKLNAWTLRLGAEVRHAMFRADRDAAVRVIVITGAGKGYCAGADMNMGRRTHRARPNPGWAHAQGQTVVRVVESP